MTAPDDRGADDRGVVYANPDFVELVGQARSGNDSAKDALVEHLKNVVWHTIGEFGLAKEDREDVFAGAFCRLFDNLNSIREPDRLRSWIATTARNEAYTLLRARGRVVPTDELGDSNDPGPPAEDRLIDRELRVAALAGFQQLSRACRELLRLCMAVPTIPYEEIGVLLEMPHGSIGPTRKRCLDRLRNTPSLRPFLEGGQP